MRSFCQPSARCHLPFSSLRRLHCGVYSGRVYSRAHLATCTPPMNGRRCSSHPKVAAIRPLPFNHSPIRRHCSVLSSASMPSDRDTLPESVKPSHYDLSLYSLQSGAPWIYNGTVKIDIDVRTSVDEIVLNAAQVKVHDAHVYTSGGSTQDAVKAVNFSYDERSARVTLKFPSALPASKSVLAINFEGTMNNQMAGFYRSKYKPAVEPSKAVARDEEWHYMFSTQFESCDARRAFPCFDEPNLKASFDFKIEIPDELVALSNMPEKEVGKGSKEGLKVVSFQRTPVMSTYLLAWAFGDFEYVEDFTRRKYNGKNLPVRVYTTRGLKEQGRFALEEAHQVVDLFSEIFEIDYPLPKADLLAVHEFSHGAMENWGLVTYRTTAVLFDEANSDAKYKNRVAYVVAHELAHQWFGNLVTMDWWNELWLNEGFATWVGWLAVDKLHPEWNVWVQFVAEGMQVAYNLDSIRSSHPIEVPVRDALEVDQIFDAISYQKGSSVIRMLSAHLTREVFLKGVAMYLKKHAYSNARTDDLWAALSTVSGQDVKAFIDPWVRKIGFPVLTVAEEPGQISICQNRFLVTGDVKPEEDSTVWWTPLGLKSGPQAQLQAPRALTTKEDTIRGIDDSFYKLNSDQTGLYRTNYPLPRLIALAESKDKLSEADKCGLVGDAAALAISGHAHTTALLSLIEGFQSEDQYHVWSQVLTSLGHVRTVFSSNAAVSEGLRKFTLKLVTPATEKLGWTFSPEDGLLTSQLRALLISSAGLAGHESTVAHAQELFQRFFGGDEAAIPGSLRSPVWRIAQSNGGQAEQDALQNYFKTTPSIDGRELALSSMGRVSTPELTERYFDFMLASVPAQDIHSVAMALGGNGRADVRAKFWELIKKHWTRIRQDYGANILIVERFLRFGLGKFAEREVGEDVQRFFADKNTEGFDRALAIVVDNISANSRYGERDAALVGEWLSARGYM